MSEDIDPILDSWGTPSGARKIAGADGVEKVQLRVEVNGHRGILQLNCDGRPDGGRPHGCDFALDFQVEMFGRHVGRGHPAEEFRLSHDEAVELIEEAVVMYQRYVVLLQLGDYERVIRDTDRNMRLFRFLKRHAGNEEDGDALEKWWPYIIRIHHTARAFLAAERRDFEKALAAVREGEREMLVLSEQDDDTFRIERDRSVRSLSEMETFFAKSVPPEEIALLEDRKLTAIEREDYERAARLRDKIERLRGKLEEDS